MAPELGFDAPAVIAELFAHGQHAHLLRGQPERKGTGEVLNEDADKALHRAKRSAVNHHRPVGAIVGADVFQIKAFGQIVIKLHSA